MLTQDTNIILHFNDKINKCCLKCFSIFFNNFIVKIIDSYIDTSIDIGPI